MKPLIVVALLALSSSAYATDWLTPVVIHGGARVADCYPMRGATSRGAQEVGPIGQHTGATATCAIGGAVFMGADVLAQKTNKKWLVWTVRVVSVGAGVYAYKRNSEWGRK